MLAFLDSRATLDGVSGHDPTTSSAISQRRRSSVDGRMAALRWGSQRDAGVQTSSGKVRPKKIQNDGTCLSKNKHAGFR
jgi:hypothetical protein